MKLWRWLFSPRCDHDWYPDFWGMVELGPGQTIFGVIDKCSRCEDVLVRFP